MQRVLFDDKLLQRPEVDSAKVAGIAAKSFEMLPFEEETEPEKEKSFSFSALFASWFKPALAFSLAVAVVIAVTLFNREEPLEKTEETFEIETASGAKVAPKTKEDYASGERESGAKVQLAKATISYRIPSPSS